MGKLIYMDQTIKLMGMKDAAYTKELIQQGTVKQTKEGVPYLVITQN